LKKFYLKRKKNKRQGLSHSHQTGLFPATVVGKIY